MDIVQNVKGRKIQYVKLTPIDSKAKSKTFFWGLMPKPNTFTVWSRRMTMEPKHVYRKFIQDQRTLSKTLFTFDQAKYERRILHQSVELMLFWKYWIDTYWLHLKTFVSVFVILMFIFVLQTIWLYISELAGKRFGRLGYLKISLVCVSRLIPLVLPLTILVTSLMVLVFGTLWICRHEIDGYLAAASHAKPHVLHRES